MRLDTVFKGCVKAHFGSHIEIGSHNKVPDCLSVTFYAENAS